MNTIIIALLVFLAPQISHAESIVEIYDLLHVFNTDPETNVTSQVFTSDQIYSFPWNTNVSINIINKMV